MAAQGITRLPCDAWPHQHASSRTLNPTASSGAGDGRTAIILTVSGAGGTLCHAHSTGAPRDSGDGQAFAMDAA